jgi:hypothetical protein
LRYIGPFGKRGEYAKYRFFWLERLIDSIRQQLTEEYQALVSEEALQLEESGAVS